MGALLRRYHDAVGDYSPPADTEWWVGKREVADGEIVLHGDPGPWNTIWRDGAPVALVDFDFVLPGPPLRDLAYAAFFSVPMGDDEHCRACRFSTPPERRHRLQLLCDAYGWNGSLEAMHEAIIDHWRQEADAIERLGRRGITPWDGFLARGLHDEDRRVIAWLEANRSTLV